MHRPAANLKTTFLQRQKRTKRKTSQIFVLGFSQRQKNNLKVKEAKILYFLTTLKMSQM